MIERRKMHYLAASLMLAVSIFLVEVKGSEAASVIDSPHTEANAITCSTCHSYSVWWQYSPVFTEINYPDLVDAVCNQCHGSTGPAFVKVGHSTSSMGAPHPAAGTWSTKCVDCHDPHTQKQLGWLPLSPVFNDGTMAGGFFLVEGKMMGITDNGNGTTTFQYTNGLAKAGWQDAADWTRKSGHDGRGLMLALGYAKAEQTYEVTAAVLSTVMPSMLPATGSGTITVQTGSDSFPVQYENTPFGLFYGQLVKNVIKTPNSGSRDVKFFDGKDGLVTTNATPSNGVCQVCHTVTKYWRNDGDADLSTGKLHNPAITCTVCHRSETGFKPSGGPHTFLGESPACMTCHPSGDILAIHKNNCQHCHTIPPILADPNSKPLVSLILKGTCQDCHGAQAHPSGTAHNHRQTTASCAGCHDVSDATAVDALHKQDCGTCHGYDGTKLNPAIVSAAIATGQSGTDVNCQTCHTIGHDTETDHNHRQVVASCVSCHAVADAAAVDALHKLGCATCHDYNGTKLDQATVSAAIVSGKGGTDVNCQTCHSAGHDTTTVHNHRMKVDLCAECHAISTPAAVDILHRSDCTTCHGYSGTKLNPATIAAVIASGMNNIDVNCQSCHLDNAATMHHLQANAISGNCTACHTDPRPGRNGITPGDNGGTSLYPTQLACRQCHVRVVGTTIYVDKLTFDVNNGGPVTRTNGQHTIAGVTDGAIQNYGMCLSCHDGSKATKVTVYHAKPKNRVDTPAKAATPPPGRGTFNLFYTELTTSNTYEPFRNTTPSGSTNYRSIRRSSQNPLVSYKSIAIPCNAANGCTSGATVNVPVMPALGVPPDLYIASSASPAGERSAVLTGTFNTEGTAPRVFLGPYEATVANWTEQSISITTTLSLPCDYYWAVVVKANGNNSNQVYYTGCHYTVVIRP